MEWKGDRGYVTHWKFHHRWIYLGLYPIFDCDGHKRDDFIKIFGSLLFHSRLDHQFFLVVHLVFSHHALVAEKGDRLGEVAQFFRRK